MAERWSEYAALRDLNATVEDVASEYGLFAIQVPDSADAVGSVATDDIDSLSRFSTQRTLINDIDCLVARTGYTGEDGFEIFVPIDESERVWSAFDGIQPCGLGARDTLRLEAGLLLSGQDFDPETEPRTPLEAGLKFVVDDSKGEFVGQDALREQEAAGIDERLVGIRVDDRSIARHGYPLYEGASTDGDPKQIGHVTSGTMSPTLGVPIALGYVDVDNADEGTKISVGVRSRTIDATVVGQRFLQSINEDGGDN